MQGRRGWGDIGAGKSKDKPILAASAAQRESKEVEKSEAILTDTIRSTLLSSRAQFANRRGHWH